MEISLRVKFRVEIIFLLLVCNVFGQNSTSSSSLTFHQKEVLDDNSALTLEWNVSLESKTILLTIETNRGGNGNYVALGLTKKGRLEEGNDVILTGIGENGRPFVVDMVALNNRTVVQDRNQDWKLLDGRSLSSGGSRITIQRGFDACDGQDTPFNTDLIHVVWSQGESQTMPSQLDITFSDRSRPIYFLDAIAIPAPEESETLQSFRVSRRFLVPARHTSYWCSIHKLNVTLNQKHHIVGFAPYFKTELGRKHVHHQIIYRCIAPPGSDPEQLFQPFADQIGEECYINKNRQLPYAYCAEYLHEWAVGGRDVPFSDNVGFALGGETPVEYFLYESHYDNPEVRDDLDIETGVDFVYSSRLRPNEGGILLISHSAFGQWAMPPQTSEFDFAGNCGPECTRTMFPPEGIEILAIRLHAHLSSRRVRIKHFRDGVEKKWIHNDDNYDFNYQQWRWLYNPVKVLPGDQITVQCGFDNTWKNDSSSTVSGYSTRDEMCVSWLLINKRLPHAWCMSEYPTENTLARFGIQNMTWDLELHDRVIHSATDPSNVGLTFTQLTTNVMRNWTPEQKLELENDQLYTEQYAYCPNYISAGRIHRYLSLIQEELPEGVEFPLPEGVGNEGVSDTTLTTPGRTSRRARYPREVPQYIPPTSCPAPGAPNVDEGNTGGNVDNGQMPQNMNNFGEGNWPRRFPFKRKDSVWGWGAGDKI